MSLRNLNLNLLTHLDALLSERSVTRAARVLGLTQPTLSASLAKLRQHFEDPLLVRMGTRQNLTPLAAQLQLLASAALAGVESVFTSTERFDPTASQREFRILASDYWVELVGSAVCRRALELDASVKLRFGPVSSQSLAQPDQLLRSVDAVMAPRGAIAGFESHDLLHAEWVCLVSQQNTKTNEKLTLSDLGTLEWVVLASTRSENESSVGLSLGMRQLALMGVTPQVAVTVDSFLAVPAFISGTDRIALVHRGLASRVAEQFELRMLDCPFNAPLIEQALWWHPIRNHDPSHRWLREVVVAAARDIVEQDLPGIYAP